MLSAIIIVFDLTGLSLCINESNALNTIGFPMYCQQSFLLTQNYY